MNSKQQQTSHDPSHQPTLFDALAAADDAIRRVDENADEGWKRAAARIVWEFAKMRDGFTTDDVMEGLEGMGVVTHDNRALGPVMRRMIRKNIIHEIGMTRSRRRHGARIPVYAGVSTTGPTQERGE